MDTSYALAKQFLSNIDPNAKYFTFQTFSDSKNAKNDKNAQNLTTVRHGTLEENFEALSELNAMGAGVAVTVQETDGRGRRAENIRTIRSVFFENDNCADISRIPLRPSMIVRTSPGKSHAYFILEEPQPISIETVAQFKSIMRYMVSMGSDKNATDITRALRLPGFWNNKYSERFLAKIEPRRLVTYTWDELVETLKPPSPNLTQAELDFFMGAPAAANTPFKNALNASALFTVDPDCDYDTWLRLGMAIHHASGGSKQGLDLFQKWSKRGASYNEKDWPDKWRSFRQDPEKPVTEKTLWRIAREYGWKGQYHEKLTDIRLYVALERSNAFRHMNKYYALLRTQNGLRVCRKTTNDMGHLTYGNMSPQQSVTFFANRKVPAWSKPNAKGEFRIKAENVFTQWCETEKRHEFDGLEFLPDKDIVIDKINSRQLPITRKLNTYFGLHNPGKKGQWNHIKDHIMEVWCKGNKAAYDYIIGWFAHMFQNPGEPGQVCVTVRSDRQGAGKNIIVDEIVKAWGVHGNVFSTPRQITGNFNSLLSESIFVVLEEAVWSGNNMAKSFLKSAITSPFIVCERKFEDARTIRNCAHIFCMSNAEWVVPIEPGDRRYFILDCDNRYVGNVNYFNRFAKHIKGGEADAMIYDLRTMDINQFNVTKFPSIKGTRAKAMEYQLDSADAYISEVLEAGDFFFQQDGENGDGVITEKGANVSKTAIYKNYMQFLLAHNSRNNHWTVFNQTQFGMRLKRIFPKEDIWRKSSVRYNGSPYPVPSYKSGSLFALRKAFDEYLGAAKDWQTCVIETDDPELEELFS